LDTEDRGYSEEKDTLLNVILAFALSLLVVIGAMPTIVKMLEEKKMCGTDVHKPNKPEVPKGAGFILLFAIVGSLLFCTGITTFQAQEVVSPGLLAALVSILMAGMIGLLDDNFDFRNRTKVAVPLIASIPMMAMQVGVSTMQIPFFGTLDLGLLYPLIIVPLMMTFIIDSTNMYGGMNGLEVGLAIVNSSAIVLFMLLLPLFTGVPLNQGQSDAFTIAAALLGGSIAFYAYNRYPAKVLPGDVGRLPLGATIAAALILGNMDRLAIFLYITFMLNFLMYLGYRVYVKRKGMEWVKFADVKEDGSLEVVGPFTMYWLFPWLLDGIDEKKNVRLLIALQAVIAYAAVILLLVGVPLGFGWI
jgi:UDP-N-acetylglucosamine--dolichyl-phosphate N-acetylglucosaminephosphotransferase